MDYQKVFDTAGRLANEGKYDDAGKHILESLNIAPNQGGSLGSKPKKLAYLAATYFAKGNYGGHAVELYLSLGERQKAADLLEKMGDVLSAQKVREGTIGSIHSISNRSNMGAVGGTATNKFTAKRLESEGKIELAIKSYVSLHMYGDAARLQKKQGKLQEAANMYAEGGLAYEAAVCFYEVGDMGKSLENLVRVPRTSPMYRHAALRTIALGVQLNRMSFKIDNFLAEFLRTAPKDTNELEALYQLGYLYEQHDFLQNAQEVFEKIVQVKPDYKNAQKKLNTISQFSSPSKAMYEKIRAQEASFHGEQRKISPDAYKMNPPADVLPDLPPVPELPELNTPVDLSEKNAPPVETGSAKQSVSNEVSNNVTGFNIGDTIASRYVIQKEIGRGGMAAVYKAKDTELDESIALKLFLTQINDERILKESEARFKQELKLSRKLNHKNIIRLYDIGLFQGHRYISMELLVGSDLERRLEKYDGPYDMAKGLYLMIQACAGLFAAHEYGVVHRDIKPENLFVSDKGELKVMDFGIAKNTVQPGMTMDGMMAGTPHYIAPEQINSFTNVTHSADLYSLGVVMYRMFTGYLPFDHQELTKLLMMHVNLDPLNPSELNPQIPQALEAIILKLMSKSPAKRFKTAKELATKLKAVYTQLVN